MPKSKEVSEESTSPTLSMDLEPSLIFEKLLDKQLATSILTRTLAVGSILSTTSSFVERSNAAIFGRVDHPDLRDIGRGSCGSVFEVPGSTKAIKKSAHTDALWNDFELTNRAYNSYLTCARVQARDFPGRCTPRVPQAQNFYSHEADEWWAVNLSRFPTDDQTIAAAFYMDRILPVPSLTREALIRQFFDEDKQVQQDVFLHAPNKDCLIRVYFGENNPNTSPYGRTDTLRNFPLYLDQAKMIGLDVNKCAEEMAMGLAILHWEAQIDAQDTEFVIGSSALRAFAVQHAGFKPNKAPKSSMDSFSRRETQLWMLDFDKCSKVDMDSKDPTRDVVRKYLVAVTGNDPYFPHPRLDSDLWRRFRKTYLDASKFIIENNRLFKQHVARLPAMLIQQWEQWGNEDMEAKEFDPFERNSGDEQVESESEADDDETEEHDSEEEGDDGADDSSEDEE